MTTMAMKSSSSDVGTTPIKSKYLKTVCLKDWWLIKSGDGKGLCMGGLEVTDKRVQRVFSSAPITARYNLFTLKTADEINILIQGTINTSRTLENGFSSQVCSRFLLGFPYDWKNVTDQCLAAGNVASSKNMSSFDESKDVLSSLPNFLRGEENIGTILFPIPGTSKDIRIDVLGNSGGNDMGNSDMLGNSGGNDMGNSDMLNPSEASMVPPFDLQSSSEKFESLVSASKGDKETITNLKSKGPENLRCCSCDTGVDDVLIDAPVFIDSDLENADPFEASVDVLVLMTPSTKLAKAKGVAIKGKEGRPKKTNTSLKSEKENLQCSSGARERPNLNLKSRFGRLLKHPRFWIKQQDGQVAGFEGGPPIFKAPRGLAGSKSEPRRAKRKLVLPPSQKNVSC